MTTKHTMTEAEVCKFLGISRTTLWRLRSAGKLSYYRVATKVLYSLEHVEELLTNCERRMRPKTPRLVRTSVKESGLR
jgi:excisionase family DNA binding protein